MEGRKLLQERNQVLLEPKNERQSYVNELQGTFVINPCPNHSATHDGHMHEATHIDLNLKLAICDECAIKATQKKAHEVVNLHKIVNESRCVLVNLESQIEELVKDNRSAQTRGGSLVQMISTKKQRFK